MAKTPMNRKDFLLTSALLGGLAPLAGVLKNDPSQKRRENATSDGERADPFAAVPDQGQQELEMHLFSKHLHFLDYEDMAKAASDIGFEGVDLTVRPGGHVEPERVREDLPRAIEALQREGLMHRMMTTAVDDADDQIDQAVLSTAAETGIEYYRMNWFRYDPERELTESVARFRHKLEALGELNREFGLIGCYQNHAGLMAGASMWELATMLEQADPEVMGIQYDIRHATVEGGLSWETGLRLVHPKIRTLALKDFRWSENDGNWRAENVPIGEGMVDFTKYFRLLKEYGVQVPVSIHFEYPLGGAERGRSEITVDKEVVFRAMKRDLQTLRRLWREA